MKKYKNLGSGIGFIFNGSTIDFQNGEVRILPDDFKERIQDSIAKIEIVEEIKQTPIPEVEAKQYTKIQLKKMNKAEQVEILKGLGATKIPSLEDDRIALILRLSK